MKLKQLCESWGGLVILMFCQSLEKMVDFLQHSAAISCLNTNQPTVFTDVTDERWFYAVNDGVKSTEEKSHEVDIT